MKRALDVPALYAALNAQPAPEPAGTVERDWLPEQTPVIANMIETMIAAGVKDNDVIACPESIPLSLHIAMNVIAYLRGIALAQTGDRSGTRRQEGDE